MRRVYATSDGSRTLTLDGPDGWVMPPKITLHRPLIGPVEFYDAKAYAIRVQGAADNGELDQPTPAWGRLAQDDEVDR